VGDGAKRVRTLLLGIEKRSFILMQKICG